MWIMFKSHHTHPVANLLKTALGNRMITIMLASAVLFIKGYLLSTYIIFMKFSMKFDLNSTQNDDSELLSVCVYGWVCVPCQLMIIQQYQLIPYPKFLANNTFKYFLSYPFHHSRTITTHIKYTSGNMNMRSVTLLHYL